MTIIINNPGYSKFETKLITTAFNAIQSCPKQNKSLHASILCHRRKIVSVGINYENKSHPLSQKIGRTTHAELACIIQCRHYDLNFSKMSMYNIRIDRYNQIRNSKPCLSCIELLSAYKIGKVFYTSENGIFKELI